MTSDGMEKGRIAVISGGLIGGSWASLFLAKGHSVVVSDPAPDSEEVVRGGVAAAWPDLEHLGVTAYSGEDDRPFRGT